MNIVLLWCRKVLKLLFGRKCLFDSLFCVALKLVAGCCYLYQITSSNCSVWQGKWEVWQPRCPAQCSLSVSIIPGGWRGMREGAAEAATGPWVSAIGLNPPANKFREEPYAAVQCVGRGVLPHVTYTRPALSWVPPSQGLFLCTGGSALSTLWMGRID